MGYLFQIGRIKFKLIMNYLPQLVSDDWREFSIDFSKMLRPFPKILYPVSVAPLLALLVWHSLKTHPNQHYQVEIIADLSVRDIQDLDLAIQYVFVSLNHKNPTLLLVLL